MNFLQVWQLNTTSFDQVVQDAKAHGFDAILQKAIDGTSWMNKFDQSPWAIDGPLMIEQLRIVAHSHGLQFYVWTNPLWSVDQLVQALMTAQAANAADGLFLDVEPYSGSFWGAWRPVGDARKLMQRIRSQAEHATIILQPDPRTARLAEIRPTEWMDYCNAIAGQHYHVDFGTHIEDEIQNAKNLARQFNKPAYITIQTNAPTDEVSKGAQLAQTELAGTVAYRYGNGNLDGFQFTHENDMVTVTFSRREVLANLDIMWGWTNPLEELQANEAVKQLRDSIVAVKSSLGLS